MSKSLLLSASLLLATATFIGCDQQNHAVTSAMNERVELFNSDLGAGDVRMSVRTIDVSAAPTDFQLAWTESMQAWESIKIGEVDLDGMQRSAQADEKLQIIARKYGWRPEN